MIPAAHHIDSALLLLSHLVNLLLELPDKLVISLGVCDMLPRKEGSKEAHPTRLDKLVEDFIRHLASSSQPETHDVIRVFRFFEYDP